MQSVNPLEVPTLELQVSSQRVGSLLGHKRGMNTFSTPIPHRSAKEVVVTFLSAYLPQLDSLGSVSLDGDLKQSKLGLYSYSYCSGRLITKTSSRIVENCNHRKLF